MHGCLDAVELGVVYGWAWNPLAPDQPVSVDIQLDGTTIGSCVADIFRPDLRDAGIGDGRHAFQFRLPASLLDNRIHTVSAHIPSLGVPIGPVQQAFLADEARRAVPGMAVREKPSLPLPPGELVQLVGGSDNYLAVGRSIRDVLVQQGGLLPTDRVLEIGCGVGRIAHALSEYMDAAGRYDGVEIHKPHVDWCATHITPAYPNFRFHHADIWNAAYNPGGAVPAAGYRLPFAEGAFDFVFLASVFTHMREADIRAYLAEIRRVLTPGGRLMATFFLLDAESRAALEAGTPRLELPYRTDRFWAHSEDCPEVAIAFRNDIVMAMLEEAGLAVDRVAPGDWAPRTGGSLSYQDIIFARRP